LGVKRGPHALGTGEAKINRTDQLFIFETDDQATVPI